VPLQARIPVPIALSGSQQFWLAMRASITHDEFPMIRANCRARFTAADFDFVVRTLARSQTDQVSLVESFERSRNARFHSRSSAIGRIGGLALRTNRMLKWWPSAIDLAPQELLVSTPREPLEFCCCRGTSFNRPVSKQREVQGGVRGRAPAIESRQRDPSWQALHA
jgi:hypothetical protein